MDIATIAIVIATILGGALSGPFVLEAWKKWYERLCVKRIVDPDDDDLQSICEMQGTQFSDDVADSYEDMRRWVAEALEDGQSDLIDILLALKEGNLVSGYMYAQYYKSSQYLFVSYIAIDKSSIAAKKEGAQCLYSGLISLCLKHGYAWKAILAEVEESKKKRSNHGKTLMTNFSHAIRKLAPQFGADCRLYRLMVDYVQPILRPDEIIEGRESSPEMTQWLLYIPRNTADVIVRQQDKTFIAKDTAADILKNIFLNVYGDAYKEPKYRNYLASQLKRQIDCLAELVEVRADPRLC